MQHPFPVGSFRITHEQQIDKIRGQMAELQRKGAFDKLAELQYGKLPQLEAQLKAAENAMNPEAGTRVGASGTAGAGDFSSSVWADAAEVRGRSWEKRGRGATESRG